MTHSVEVFGNALQEGYLYEPFKKSTRARLASLPSNASFYDGLSSVGRSVASAAVAMAIAAAECSQFGGCAKKPETFFTFWAF